MKPKVNGEGNGLMLFQLLTSTMTGWRIFIYQQVLKKNTAKRRNLLYVNQGLDQNKIPVFKEMAAEYGLADTS